MAKNYILCSEATADDDNLFWMEAGAELLGLIEVIEVYVFDEAGHWGGFKVMGDTAALSAARKTALPVVDTETVKRLYAICCAVDEEFDFRYYEFYYQQLMNGVTFSAKELKYVEVVKPTVEEQATIVGELNGHKIQVVPVRPPSHPEWSEHSGELRYRVYITVSEKSERYNESRRVFDVLWFNSLNISVKPGQGNCILDPFSFTIEELHDWLRANIDPEITIQFYCGTEAAYFLQRWVEADQCYETSARDNE